MNFFFKKLKTTSMWGEYQNETYIPTQDEIDNVKNLIKNIKVDGNQLETEMLPLNMSLKDINKIDITQEGQEGGGNIGLGGENYKLKIGVFYKF